MQHSWILIVLAATALIACGRKPPPPAGHDAVTHFVVPAGDAAALPAPRPAPDAVEPDVEPEPAAGEPMTVPDENREKGTPPDPSSAEKGARLLFEAIRADDPSLASGFFFPEAVFSLVKNMDDPSNYHRKLVRFYQEDVHVEHDRFWGVESMEFEAFEMGKCTWKEPYTQGNKIPYWSCRNSRMLARGGSKLFDYKIRAIINWGDRWYLVHLGPIRKL